MQKHEINKHPYANTHPAELTIEEINNRTNGTLIAALGIKYTAISKGKIEATMPVGENTRQPSGILHGGASLALSETLAGIGSMVMCSPDETAVGMQVSGNHIATAKEGDIVKGIASIMHQGKSTHVWNIDIFSSSGKLVSSVRVVNCIIKRKQ